MAGCRRWLAQAADEPVARPAIAAQKYLVPQSEIDAIRLSMVDEKLALSLAVETHIQIELAEFAMTGIRHGDLKRFTEKSYGTTRSYAIRWKS